MTVCMHTYILFVVYLVNANTVKGLRERFHFCALQIWIAAPFLPCRIAVCPACLKKGKINQTRLN